MNNRVASPLVRMACSMVPVVVVAEGEVTNIDGRFMAATSATAASTATRAIPSGAMYLCICGQNAALPPG